MQIFKQFLIRIDSKVGKIRYLIRQTSERITVARRALSILIRQISVKSVIASLTFRSGISGLTLATELATVIYGAGQGKVPVSRRTLTCLAGLTRHGFAIKSGSTKFAVRSGCVFSTVLYNCAKVMDHSRISIIKIKCVLSGKVMKNKDILPRVLGLYQIWVSFDLAWAIVFDLYNI